MADKNRPLHILKYLWDHTDEDHPAIITDILAHLEECGIHTNRKTVASDLAELQDSGFDVVCNKSRQNQYFIGNAGLLTESESASLEATLEAVGAKHSLEIAIYTTVSLGDKTATEYADDVFDSMYGDVDGVLLLISMEYGDWQISTCGKGITIFTDAGIDYIGEKVVAYLVNDDFKNAFDEFAQLCDDFAVQAESGEPYDSSNLPREPLSALWIVIALVVGFLLALMVVGNMKSKLKTVRSQDGAASYIRDGSMNITNSSDLYLYRTVTRTKKAEENNNSSSGSSTHTSSSGTTHGGGGGKF